MKFVIIFILCLLALFVLWLLVGIICALFVDKTKDCKKVSGYIDFMPPVSYT